MPAISKDGWSPVAKLRLCDCLSTVLDVDSEKASFGMPAQPDSTQSIKAL
jgi:hypothetical protein